jgi:hypothetical protein
MTVIAVLPPRDGITTEVVTTNGGFGLGFNFDWGR